MSILLWRGFTRGVCLSSGTWAKTVDRSRLPVIREQDLEENFVRGSGPGGQAVNKTANCVTLKHLPSGIVIKCHQTRSLDKNRLIAREMLVKKLDNLLNGELSVDSQMQVIAEKKENERERRRKKLNLMKEAWRKREGISDNASHKI